ncbi:hypothetical protein CEP49_08690 [Mergibacter septicus]|nr:hypothetical protein CEP49_08690 [Mergibacter septicus]
MSLQTQLLYSNTWTVRISDHGEEGTFNHLFKTTKVNLIARKRQIAQIGITALPVKLKIKYNNTKNYSIR